MHLSVMVLGDPTTSSALRVALRILELASQSGNVVDTAFLYHNGAYAALNLAQDGALQQRWSQLAAQTGLRCVVCRSAWQRLDPPGPPLPPFRLGGLADWIGACERSNKVLRFGRLRIESAGRQV